MLRKKLERLYQVFEKTEIYITCNEYEGICILEVKEPYEEK